MQAIEDIGCLIEIGDSSCSGLIVNNSHVLTHSSIFIPHLMKDPSYLSGFLNIEEVSFQQSNAVVKHKENNVIQACVKLKKERNIIPCDATVLHVWKAQKFAKTHRKLFPKYGKWKFADENVDMIYGNSVKKGKDVIKDISATKVDNEVSDMIAKLMPYFVLIKLNSQSSIPLEDLGRIVVCKDVEKGLDVFVVSTPFGSVCPPVFYNSVSVGVVSQYIDGGLILTDAKVAPGTEGAPLCVYSKTRGVEVAGLIVAPLFWKNTEWLGLSIACSMTDIINSLLQTTREDIFAALQQLDRPQLTATPSHSLTQSPPPPHLTPHPALPLTLQLRTVVLIQGAGCWGTGVCVDSRRGYVLTCAHVVKGCETTVHLRLYNMKWLTGDIIYRPAFTQDPLYDLALLRIRDWSEALAEEIPQLKPAMAVSKGMSADVLGHTPFGQECHTSAGVFRGVVSQIVYQRKTPILFLTSCTVQAGASGGPVLDSHGRLIGIVTSNARDTVSGGSYPHINLVVPTATIWPHITTFLQNSDPEELKNLEIKDKFVQKVWALQAKELAEDSKTQKSKL